MDALSISWKGVIGYAYPPIVLIPKVLQKIQEGGCKIILIAPFWTRQPWFPILTQLLVDYPCETTRDQRSDKSTQKQVVSSKRKHVKADSMEIISRQLVKKGFSRSVSKRAASCRRASTYSTYNNRLGVFFNWARRKHIDPLQASESQIAEFLEHLFRARKLKARTIARYKSAISAVHPGWDGVSVGKAQTLESLWKLIFWRDLQRGNWSLLGILVSFSKLYVNIHLNL